MRAAGQVRRAAACAESVVDFRALERVREAMGASDVKSRDRVRVATGSGGSVCIGGTLGDCAPWGWGCDRPGVGWEVLGIMKWCFQVRWVAVELLAGGEA